MVPQNFVVSLTAIALLAYVCPAEPQSVTLEQAVQRLHATMATIPHLNQSDLLSHESEPRYKAAMRYVRERQCLSRTANPLLAIASPASLNLRGSLDANNAPRVAENFEFPLRVAALSDLPKEYLKETAVLSTPGNLPVEMAAKLNRELHETYENLAARVSYLLKSFDAAGCPRDARGATAPDREPRFLFIAPTY